MLMNQNIPEEGSKVYSATLDPLAKLYGYTFSEEQIQSMISSDMVVEHATTELFLDLILEHATINYIPSEEGTN